MNQTHPVRRLTPGRSSCVFIFERLCDDGLMTAEEVFDVVSRMTGEFANHVVRNAVDGVPVQFIDAEL